MKNNDMAITKQLPTISALSDSRIRRLSKRVFLIIQVSGWLHTFVKLMAPTFV